MPINLAGGGRAGGVGDALLEIVKQRLLEQELNQRQQDQELRRRREDRMDARQADETTYNRGRDKEASERQNRLDQEAATAKTQQQQVAKYGLLKGQSQSDINEALGEDPSTAHVIPAAPNPNVPGNAPSFKLPAVPMQSNKLDIGGIGMRPPSAEVLDRQAADDEKRKFDLEMQKQAELARLKPKELQHVEGTYRGQQTLGAFDPATGKTEPIPDWAPKPPAPSQSRDRYSIQQVTMADGTTGLIRVNMDTGQPESVKMPEGVAGAGKVTTGQERASTAATTSQAAGLRATSFEDGLKGLGAQFAVQLPNLITTPSGRQYRTAEREWIETVLRPRSGAAIRPDEYDNYAAMYFVQPGDDVGSIQMKQAARARAERSFVDQSGNLKNKTAPVDTNTAPAGVEPDWIVVNGKLVPNPKKVR